MHPAQRWLSFAVLSSAVVVVQAGESKPAIPPALVTDRTTYVASTSGLGIQVSIGLRYTNTSGARRYIHDGQVAAILEKVEDGKWVVVLDPVVISRGLRVPTPFVEPGGTYAFTFTAAGSRGGYEPFFRAKQIAGTYRVRWQVYRAPVLSNAFEWEDVISNTFEVTPEDPRYELPPLEPRRDQ